MSAPELIPTGKSSVNWTAIIVSGIVAVVLIVVAIVAVVVLKPASKTVAAPAPTVTATAVPAPVPVTPVVPSQSAAPVAPPAPAAPQTRVLPAVPPIIVPQLSATSTGSDDVVNACEQATMRQLNDPQGTTYQFSTVAPVATSSNTATLSETFIQKQSGENGSFQCTATESRTNGTSSYSVTSIVTLYAPVPGVTA
jgi:hypothetical protein